AYQPLPRNHLFHLRKKLLPAGLPLFPGKLSFGKTHLAFHAPKDTTLARSCLGCSLLKSAFPKAVEGAHHYPQVRKRFGAVAPGGTASVPSGRLALPCV